MSTKPKTYYQCLLRRGCSLQHAWIEDAGAREGAQVELLPSREPWEVVTAFRHHALSDDQLREMKQLHRGSLPSVEPMR